MKRRQERGGEAGEARVELLPEGLRVVLPGGGDGKEGAHVLLRACSTAMRERLELPQHLSRQPLMLARLLEEGAGALGDLLPASPPWRMAAEGDWAAAGAPVAACSCGEAACGHLPEAMAIGEAAWAADAGLRLALVGWAPEALADAALACWAAAQPLPEPEAALRAYAGGPDAPQRSARGEGPHLAEWLADMAGQGHLHLPGPRFHDVAAGLQEEFRHRTPPGSASAAEPRLDREPGSDAAPWAALLPGVSGAAKGLELVAARVRERAAELAAGPPPGPAGSPNGKIRR
ncbi:hypothetical protein KQJ23_16790 [Paenibacillus sp. MSJ-6]|uniref:SWIM-type domain-containing protein n=2 Tax=Paenibacillus brevis TaxID=2841508 RepID=A0ABS6FU43_9BACL|nr:hypothetical protein [Paenibacillus brevis]